jgi:hypothetical protein
MARFKQRDAPDAESNFGLLQGGWIRVGIPELNLDKFVLAYGSDAVAESAKLSHFNFEGLVGLPLLRMTDYGGDANWFWLQCPSRTP